MISVALIPARGGSRRVPRKNIRPFLGTPAITRTLDVVERSGVVDRVVVSTDDDAIAAASREAGAEVPGRRPAALADDHTTTLDVVRHAITTWLADLPNEAVVWVVYPTALLLAPEDLRLAAERYESSGADFLVPVLRYPHPVERRLRMDPLGLVRPESPEHLTSRTQDLAPAFHDAGQFYVGSIAAWMSSGPFLSATTLGLELPNDRIVDIDTPEDWQRAERRLSSGPPSH